MVAQQVEGAVVFASEENVVGAFGYVYAAQEPGFRRVDVDLAGG
jgi:hypothetical protein